jgi:hypothetical protein
LGRQALWLLNNPDTFVRNLHRRVIDRLASILRGVQTEAKGIEMGQQDGGPHGNVSGSIAGCGCIHDQY